MPANADAKVVFASADAEQFARAVDRLLRLAGGKRASKMELALRVVIGEVDRLRMELARSQAGVAELRRQLGERHAG